MRLLFHLRAVTLAFMQVRAFPGGLKLPSHRQESLAGGLRHVRSPERLRVALAQSSQTAAQAVVAVGERVRTGQLIGAAVNAVAVHAPGSGVISAIGAYPVIHPSGLPGACIEIALDGLDEWVALDPDPDWRSRTPAELLEKIIAAGIVGLGGAAFPTALKVGASRPISHLLINGAECEPYIACDNALMINFPAQVLEGVEILRALLQPERVILALEDSHSEAMNALKSCAPECELVAVPTRYPEGGERQLIYALTGLEVPATSVPLALGILSINVATARAVYRAVRLGEPLISRIVTVTGAGALAPCNVEVRLGTLIGDLLEGLGGYGENAERLVIGGPLMGLALPHDQHPISKASNCILLLGADEVRARGAPMPCIRCGECARVCPVRLAPQLMHLTAQAGDLEAAFALNTLACIECGLCSFVCPSHIPLAQEFRVAKFEIRLAADKRVQAQAAKERFEARQQRLDRINAERAARRAQAGTATNPADALARAQARKAKIAAAGTAEKP